jgi:UDP-4-amino-4-deoxy-L-arabinose formyltransferase/UDP-glucuronic acid dehydrogenase (UDP-4-keto-hexauronic acid decarboxylating)
MGAAGLRVLLRHDCNILKVYALEADPEEKLCFEKVADFCSDRSLPFSVIEDPNAASPAAEVRELSPDIIFSLSFPKIFRPELLAIPAQGALNLHLSLLPKQRGLSPVNRALIMGERKTGVTLHYMIEKPNAGDIVGQAETWIEKQDTVLTLHKKLAELGGELLDELLTLIKEGRAPRTPLDVSQGSFFSALKTEDGKIVWTKSSWEAYNLIRALTRPYTGAYGHFMGEKMIIWKAAPDDATAGLVHCREIEVEEGNVFAGTSYGALRLEEVEWKGKILKGPEIAREFEPHWREKFEK